MTNTLAANVLTTFYVNPVLYLGLHSSDPTQIGNAGTEIAGASYARQRITFGAPSNRAVTNNIQIIYQNLPASTVLFLAIWNALTGGIIQHSLGITSIAVNAGGTIVVPVSDVAITLA